MQQAVVARCLEFPQFPLNALLFVARPLEHWSQRRVVAGQGHHPIHRLNASIAIAVLNMPRETNRRLPLGQQRQQRRIGSDAGISWYQRHGL
jgi:hypothetical protein